MTDETEDRIIAGPLAIFSDIFDSNKRLNKDITTLFKNPEFMSELISARNSKALTKAQLVSCSGLRPAIIGKLITEAGYVWDISTLTYIKKEVLVKKPKVTLSPKTAKKDRKMTFCFSPALYNDFQIMLTLQNTDKNNLIQLCINTFRDINYKNLLTNSLVEVVPNGLLIKSGHRKSKR